MINITVGRPPGSKAKTKLEAKWTGTHHNSPSPCNSPPPPLTPITPDTSSTDSSSLTDKSLPVLIPGHTDIVSKPSKPILPNVTQNSDRSKKPIPSISSQTKMASTAGWYLLFIYQLLVFV